MRIQLVTQMWPTAAEPDLGSYLVPVVDRLERRGHRVEVVAIGQRGGSRAKYARLVAGAIGSARQGRPDVVFAHFLFPSGAAGALGAIAGRAPLVVMAHGQDVANLGSIPGVTAATRLVLGRASGVIANSRWLATRLENRIPAVGGRVEVIDCGVDLDAFAPRDASEARARLDWEGEGPALLCVGSLIERKNVVPLAEAFARLGRGRLAFVGDGPLRGRLEGRPGIRLVGRVEHRRIPDWIAACDALCQPSVLEPFGQAALEAMAMQRSVVATTRGGPPELVDERSGVLVDPGDADALAAGLERALELPTPNPAAREAAALHDVGIQAERMEAMLERAVAARR